MEKAFWLTLQRKIFELRKTNPSLAEAAKRAFSQILDLLPDLRWLILLLHGEDLKLFRAIFYNLPKGIKVLLGRRYYINISRGNTWY